MYALILDSEVVELSETNFNVSPSFSWVLIVPAHGTVEVGYTYDSNNDTFSAPTYTLQEYKDMLMSDTFSRKAQGVTINGAKFLTNPQSVNEMAMLLQSSMTSYSFSMADGSVSTFTQAELTDRYNAIMTYYNACSANQATLVTALDAASDPSTVDLDTGFPSRTLTV